MSDDVFDPARAYDAMVVKRVLLERFQLQARKVFDLHAMDRIRGVGGRTALNGLRLEIMEREGRRMVMELSAHVWSQTLQDETVTLAVEYPATWWQALKQRAFPAWALRRWPVRMATVTQQHTFKTIALLPGFAYEQPPNAGPELVLASYTLPGGRHR